MARRNEIVRQNPRNATCPRHPCPVLERGERTTHGLGRCVSMRTALVWCCLKRHPQESTDQEPDDSTPHGVPQRPHDVFHCSAFFLLRNHAVLQVPLQYTITYAALAKMTKIPNHAATPSPITPAGPLFIKSGPAASVTEHVSCDTWKIAGSRGPTFPMLSACSVSAKPFCVFSGKKTDATSASLPLSVCSVVDLSCGTLTTDGTDARYARH